MNTENTITLSHSQMETWQQCPRRWQLQKIHKVAQAPSEALIFGDAIHQAIEADGRAAVAGLKRLTTAELVGVFARALRVRLDGEDPQRLLDVQTRVAMRLRGLATLRAYHEQFAAGYQPQEVEAPFPEVTLAPTHTGAPRVRFTGRLDARTGEAGEGGGTIVDFKTAGKPWAPGIEHQKAQATAYLWADREQRGEQAARQVRFVVLSATQSQWWGGRTTDELLYDTLVDIRTTQRTPAQLDAYAGLVRDVAREIAETVAQTAPGEKFWARPGPLCGWCGVLGTCKVGRQWLRNRGKRPAVAMVNAAGTAVMWDGERDGSDGQDEGA